MPTCLQSLCSSLRYNLKATVKVTFPEASSKNLCPKSHVLHINAFDWPFLVLQEKSRAELLVLLYNCIYALLQNNKAKHTLTFLVSQQTLFDLSFCF